jgi:hypothetical protein
VAARARTAAAAGTGQAMTGHDTSPGRIPRWVTALDVLCLAALAVMLRSMFGDSYRISVMGYVLLSARSSLRVAMVLALLLTLRYTVWRVVPWHVRVAAWARAFWRWEPLRASWGPFLVSRLMVLIVAYVAVATIGFQPARPWRALESDILDLYARWDAGWYFGIATDGYSAAGSFRPTRQHEVAFFPGLPLLMRATSELLDLNHWQAGIVVVVVAFLWALTYVYRLARLDLPSDAARASLLFLAFYPFATCYSAVLTEAVFLLAAVGVFYHFRQGEYVRAALFGLLAGLLRPNGFLLAAPLGVLTAVPFARSVGWWPGPRAERPALGQAAFQLAVCTTPVLGMLAYATYLHSFVGEPFAFVQAQQAWGRKAFEGLAVIEARSALIETQGVSVYFRNYIVEIVEAVAAFFALAAVWPITRRLGLAYGLFVASAVLPPLISMGSISLGRYTAPLFPIFLWLAMAVPAERRPYWIAAFAAGQALIATLFFTWRPPY